MKRLLQHTSLMLTALLIASGAAGQEKNGYALEFKVTGLNNDTVYLANYLGKKLYYYDTTTTNAKGAFAFTGDSIPGGMYAVVVPGQKYFELIVNEDRIHMETRLPDLSKQMKIKTSEENKVFYDYINVIRQNKRKSGQLQQELKKAEKEEAKKALRQKLKAIDQKVRQYQAKLAEEHPNTLAGKIINMSREVQVPDPPKDAEGDSSFAYRYYKKHYFDHIDLNDPRLVRSPIFHNKMKKFITKVTVQHPDSIAKAADRMIEPIPKGTEMFKYVVQFITNHYGQSKIMGMDAVFVHMVENYYTADDAYWMDQKGLEKMRENATKLKPLLIGKKAPHLVLADTTGQFIDLYKVEAPYTVLYFWDPECGHCKKATPKLRDTYNELKDEGVEVYAVGTPLENKKWKKFIREKDLDWINVSDDPDMNENPREYLDHTTIQSLNFRDTYDIYSTPKVYLLDENKKIIAKGIGIEQLEELLRKKLGLEPEDDDPEKEKTQEN